MVEIVFDKNASRAEHIEEKVVEFLHRVSTLEQDFNAPILVFQDGKSNAYYIKCNLSGDQAVALCDINARLNAESKEAYRSNRELLLKNITYKKMKADALLGREFNDIIVEYMTTYEPIKPLKVWGGQHRIHAIMDANHEVTRNHGFRVYFDLDTTQRNELALISNTSIAVSKDTFDRMLEETVYGDALRKWCRGVKLLPEDADFPDTRSRSELITLKLARTFLVNFYQGKNKGNDLDAKDLGRFVYEPIVVKTGITGDAAYAKVRENTRYLGRQAFTGSWT